MEILFFLLLLYLVATIAVFSFSTFLGFLFIHFINACLRFLSNEKKKIIPIEACFLIGIIITMVYLYRVISEPSI